MEKKEVLELKKRFNKDSVTFDHLAGCYVDSNKNKVCKFSGKFLNLEDEEFYKYLEIAKKSLSGTMGNNLLSLEFPIKQEDAGGTQHSLMALKASGLKDIALLDAYYDFVIENYDSSGNYLILLFHDSYDVMKKTSDNKKLDESEEVYEYIISSICPVDLSKPALGYKKKEQRIGARDRDWIVGAPETAVLFPAFTDRSSDIHSCLFFTKNAKEPHTEYMSKILGCEVVRTHTENRMAFKNIIKNVLGNGDEDAAKRKYLESQQVLHNMNEEYESTHENGAEPFSITPEVLQDALETCEISKDKAEKIRNEYKDTFGENGLSSEVVVDEKNLEKSEILLEKMDLEERIHVLEKCLDEKTKDNEVIITTSNGIEEKMDIRYIDGKKYLFIPDDTAILLNGQKY